MNHRTERERELERELAHEREAARQCQEEAQDRHRQQAAARRERREAEERTATTWPEALRKNAVLHRRESGLDDPTGEHGKPDTYFSDTALACERAREIWREVEAERQPEIDALQAQIDAIREQTKTAVADRLTEESDTFAWRNLANDLREVEDLDAWLYW